MGAGGAEALRSRLAALPGVEEVDLSGYPQRVTIRCEPSSLEALGEAAVRQALAAEGEPAPEVRLEVVGQAARAGQRVRFISLEFGSNEPGRVFARVTLEWDRRAHGGEAEGEANPAGELRVAALAAARALEQLVDGATFSLVGVKELHVFDHDLVAVLLNSPQLPGRRLLGTSIISEDRRRSAVLAVLNATNRALGALLAGAE
jgi:hypothetical protein